MLGRAFARLCLALRNIWRKMMGEGARRKALPEVASPFLKYSGVNWTKAQRRDKRGRAPTLLAFGLCVCVVLRSGLNV